MALAGVTDQIVYLEEGDLVDLQRAATGSWASAANRSATNAERPVRTVHAHSGAVELGPYRHYMQKEIFEQPRAIADTLEGVEGIVPELFDGAAATAAGRGRLARVQGDRPRAHPGLRHQLLQRLHRQILARRHRGHPHPGGSGQRIPLPHQRAQPAHPGRHHQPVGETADTLAALRHAQSLGMQHTLTICNVATSAMVRECKLAYITRAGVEIGVASTKAFTTQLAGLFLLTLALAQSKGRLTAEQEAAHLKAMRHLPVALQAVLALEPQLISWAEDFARMENALFLGRGLHYPIALEGALKLKEISYIHAEAYPAGELKHGPLALVTSSMPVVTVAPNDALLEKLKSNMQEVRARGGVLYVLADADTRIESGEGLHVIRMPEHYGALSPSCTWCRCSCWRITRPARGGRMWTSPETWPRA
jgi:glucosamine--fructose-6-phosphate aminotransferase (isomerizing)